MVSSPRPQQNRILGIALRIGATTSFGFMAALIKIGYAAGISTPELVFYRFAFGLPPVLIWIAWTHDFGAWKTDRPFAHLTRSAIGLSTMVLAFNALAWLPLAEATTIGFVAPLFSVMLSALFLGEMVGRHRWSAVIAGFIGVLIIMQPGNNHLPMVGLIFALLAAFGVACVTIAIRQIGKTESTQTTVLWFTVASMLVTGALLPFYGKAHDLQIWGLLAMIGLFGGLGQLFLTSSLRYAPIAVIVPFDYTQLLWAVLLGWFLWETHPSASTWAGAAIIIASGLYTIYREHRLGRDKDRAAPPL